MRVARQMRSTIALVVLAFLCQDANRFAAAKAQNGPLALSFRVDPVGAQTPGSELTYVTTYRNVGTDTLKSIVIEDDIPPFTHFKLGSADGGVPPGSITEVRLEYSNDRGRSWDYAPIAGGGGADPGFDANVTNVRFVLSGDLLPGGASTVGVSVVVRIVSE